MKDRISYHNKNNEKLEEKSGESVVFFCGYKDKCTMSQIN